MIHISLDILILKQKISFFSFTVSSKIVKFQRDISLISVEPRMMKVKVSGVGGES